MKTEISYRGIAMRVSDSVRDRRGRKIYHVTVDGETVGIGYSAAQAIARAKAKMS